MNGARLKVTDSLGATQEWPLERFDAGLRKSPQGGFMGITYSQEELLVTCVLDEPFEKDSRPPVPGSLDAADRFVADILKNGSIEELNVLYVRLYDGLNIRIDGARDVVKRLRSRKP